MRKKYHVTYDQESGLWKGKVQEGVRASTVGETKEEVLQRTIEIAKNQGNSQVLIHKQNGRFQSERTYGKDPFPPEG